MAELSSGTGPDVLCVNQEVERHVDRHCSMESLITLDSGDDLIGGGSDGSGELAVQQEVAEEGETELAKEMSCGVTRFASEGDIVKAVSNADQTYDASKSASNLEADVCQQEVSIKKREGRRVKTDKKRRGSEKKISVYMDHANFIAGVEMEVLKEGFVTQQGNFQRLLKKYITVTNERLYIAKEKEDKLKVEVILKDVEVAEKSARNENHSFSVLTPFQQFTFVATSRKDMEEWIAAFKQADSKSKHTSILESIQHLEGQHNWFACSHSRPTYCNVCREQLHGVAWHGLSCEVCKFKSHRRCVFHVKVSCKWTTRSSLNASDVKLEQDFSIPHEWVEGNLAAGSRCVVCERACGSVRRLQDFRCIWCKQTTHTDCRSRMDKVCNLGEHRLSILPPSALQRSDIIREGMWEPYKVYGHNPVLAFVNSKSGDNQGVKFLRRLKYWLNPVQVFDLAISGPDLGLQLFQRFEKFRVIVLGGDGSIGWVLSTIDKYNLHSKCMVGVVPLGTGNDMARVLGWGAQATDEEKIPNILIEMEQSSFKLVDRWSIHFSTQQNLNISHMLGSHSPVKSRSSIGSTPGVISPRPSLSSTTHNTSPLPGPNSTMKDVGSPSSVGSDDCTILRTPSPEQSSPGTVNMDILSKGTGVGVVNGQTEHIDIVVNKEQENDSPNFNEDTLSNRSHGEKSVVCCTPEDIAKVEAFRDSISGLATNFTTNLFSENEEEVKSLTLLLGEVVTNFLRSSMVGAEEQLPITECPSNPVVYKCVILQDKLNALISNLKNESPKLLDKRTQSGSGNGMGFTERETIMARANSLNKALRSVIDVTEKALDDSSEQATHISILAKEEQQDDNQRSCSSGSIPTQSGMEPGHSEVTSGKETDLSQAIRRAHLTSLSSVVDLSPGIPSMDEVSCMNNYFCIGLGAHVAYQFNSAREKNPAQFTSRARNKLVYGYLGGKELFTNSQRFLERRIKLECDGEVIKLPPRLQGLVFLNIPSYMAGTNFWGTEKEKKGFSAPSHDDKLVEVVGVTGFSHLATTKVLGIQNQRVTQCRIAKITLLGPDKLPMQVDGEPWLQEPGTIVLSHKNKARMIFKDKAFSHSLEQWRQKNTHQANSSPYLSSTHQTSSALSSVSEVLSSDQVTMYKEVATSVRQLMTCITSESSTHTSVSMELLPYVSNVSISLKRVFQDNQISDTADISHLQDFEEDVKALVQESLWFLNVQKVSKVNREEMKSTLDDLETQLRRIIAIESSPYHAFRRASDTLVMRVQERVQDQEGKSRIATTSAPHRERSRHIPDVTIQAATIAKKIGRDIQVWENDDVCEWLKELDLEQYCENFRYHAIGGSQLLSLNKSDLQALGVTKIGHVTRLWHALQALLSDSPSLPRFSRDRETN